MKEPLKVEIIYYTSSVIFSLALTLLIRDAWLKMRQQKSFLRLGKGQGDLIDKKRKTALAGGFSKVLKSWRSFEPW